MELSIFLAKFLGLYTLIVSAVMLFRRNHLEAVAKEIFASRALLVLAGSIDLLLGLAIVIAHPIWQFDWRGLITLLGAIGIFKGIMRFAYPEQVQRIAAGAMRYGYWPIFVVALIIGLILTYYGFR
jgi:hypothetical protein